MSNAATNAAQCHAKNGILAMSYKKIQSHAGLNVPVIVPQVDSSGPLAGSCPCHNCSGFLAALVFLTIKTPTSTPLVGAPSWYSRLDTPSRTCCISVAALISPIGSFFDLLKYFMTISRTRGFSCFIHQSLAHADLSSSTSSFAACMTWYVAFRSGRAVRSLIAAQKDRTWDSRWSYWSR